MLSVGFGLKNLLSMKYSVSFIQGEKEVLLVDSLTDVQACQYAINLHQSSNQPHEVHVCEESSSASICLLNLIRK